MPKGVPIDWEQFRIETDDCLLWPYAVRNGYGIAKGPTGESTNAHRAVWLWLVGPIPDSLVLDHLCRVKLCVNTRHLELVTTGENTRRAWPYRKRAEVCGRGHDMTDPDNIWVRPDRGHRVCRACFTEDGRTRTQAARRFIAERGGHEVITRRNKAAAVVEGQSKRRPNARAPRVSDRAPALPSQH